MGFQTTTSGSTRNVERSTLLGIIRTSLTRLQSPPPSQKASLSSKLQKDRRLCTPSTPLNSKASWKFSTEACMRIFFFFLGKQFFLALFDWEFGDMGFV